MTEREKIIGLIEKWAKRTITTRVWGEGVYDPYNAAELADALIAAGLRFTFASDFASDTQKAYKGGYLKGKEESGAEIELAKAFHDEKCAEWELACYKLQKAEHRAEVAERALRKYIRKVSCSRRPYAMSCDIFPPTPKNDYIECFDEVLRLERKEIAEEG